MSDILNSLIPKIIVTVQKNNEDIVKVTTPYISPNGEVSELTREKLSPVLIQTSQSLVDLQPDVSDAYPFKIVTPVDIDGATIILSPTVETIPTASQHYYIPIYSETYREDFIQNIDKSFSELEVEPIETIA